MPALRPLALLQLLQHGITFSGSRASSGCVSTGNRWSGSYESGVLLGLTE